MISRKIDAKLSEAFEEFKGFYAFSQDQLNASLTKFGIEAKDCCSLGMGLICPKENAAALNKRMHEIVETATREVLAETPADEIIYYELCNHESYYTWSIGSAFDALSNFRDIEPEKFSRENVLRVFHANAHKHEED